MKRKTEPPSLVNHRWQLPSLEQILDDMLPQWAEGEHPDFSGPNGHARMKASFFRFGEWLLSRLHTDLEKAAGKGISEALNLVRDPDYYETVKRRRKRDREKQQEWRAKSDADSKRYQKERERRERGELTESERLHELGQLVYQISYHQNELDKLNARKSIVEHCVPVMEKPSLAVNDPDDRDSDDWADTISFD